MKKSIKVLIVLAIFSQVQCLNLGQILGMRRNWQEASSRAVEPEVVEVVRWRQPVCIVPGKNIPACLETIRNFQDDYEKSSDKVTEAASSTKSVEKKQSAVLTPEIVDSFNYENVDRVSLDGSGRSYDQSVTLNIRSSTPTIEKAQSDRKGKYLVMASFGKATTVVHKAPPAIYVTKVLNSPVTATLVANNCYPDIGVPLCDNYQETITIYKNPETSSFAEKQGTAENTDQVAGPPETTDDAVVQDNADTADFWNDPSNPNFDNGTAQNASQKPGLLEQAIQHVISRPGVINAIPPGVINAIANNPTVLEAVANAGNAGSTTTITGAQIKPQVVATINKVENIEVSSTPKPGLIGTLLDIQRPAIFDNFLTSGLNIFNKSSTPKPIVTGQGPVIQAIQNFIHRPETMSTNEKPEFKPVLVVEPTPKPGLFANLWKPGSFGLFNRLSTSTTTVRPADAAADPVVPDVEETKSVRPALVEIPERPQFSEILFKPENDISGRPTLPNILNSANDNTDEKEAKPTQAPGLFGGLFPNPARPNDAIDESVEKTKTILGMGSSIFAKPTNKPLVIERPGSKPLLVEKPIYVQEKPVESAGLLNFFIPASNKPLVTVDHEVIKEPVYVYQKPQTSSGIFSSVFGTNLPASGFFQGWATIFGNNDKNKPAEQQTLSSETETDQVAAGQNLRSTIAQPTASTIVEEPQENSESVAVKEFAYAESTADASSESEEDSPTAIDEEAVAALVDALEEEEIAEAAASANNENELEAEVVAKISKPEEVSPIDVAPVQEIAEAATTFDGSAKSTNTLEDVPEDVATKVNAELAGPINVVESALRASASKPVAVETSSPDSSSENSVTDDEIEKEGEAIAAKEIIEEQLRNPAPKSENTPKETESGNVVNEPDFALDEDEETEDDA